MYGPSLRCIARSNRLNGLAKAVRGLRPKSTKGTPRPPSNIAVLGGGLTGLATAYHLARFLPKAKITVFEASDRLGGWIDTETLNVKTPDGNEGVVRFERGGRMIPIPGNGSFKFDDMAFYELVGFSISRLPRQPSTCLSADSAASRRYTTSSSRTNSAVAPITKVAFRHIYTTLTTLSRCPDHYQNGRGCPVGWGIFWGYCPES